jgi:hypothetical protein
MRMRMFSDQRVGKRFGDDEDVDTEVRMRFRPRARVSDAASFDALVKGWNKCINVADGYVEK